MATAASSTPVEDPLARPLEQLPQHDDERRDHALLRDQDTLFGVRVELAEELVAAGLERADVQGDGTLAGDDAVMQASAIAR